MNRSIENYDCGKQEEDYCGTVTDNYKYFSRAAGYFPVALVVRSC